MNINLSVICDACETQTNCRVGMSNRREFHVQFACQECSNLIEINFNEKDRVVGATEVPAIGPFDDKINFVDLHPDFPVSFGKYVMGNTPFLQAVQRQGHEEIMFHKHRTDFLNAHIDKVRLFETLLKHYKRDKIKPFSLNLEKHFAIQLESQKPQDINAGLYSLIARMMYPFAFPQQDEETVAINTQLLFEMDSKHHVATQLFVNEIIDNGFLKQVQWNCLDIYPQMMNSDMVFRPALFLDFDEEYADRPIAMRVSTDDFQSFKDLYKDIAETISKLMVLVAGTNNLEKRGDHNAFQAGIGLRGKKDFTPSSLQKYADMPYGNKKDMIDDSWFEFVNEAVDNQLRNAIAHVKTEYDDVTQIVTYYPRKEGMKSKKPEQMSFLEFIRRILVSYREMHRLHHLVTALFYYKYLVSDRS